MSITITGKLNKAANQFQAGDSQGFGLRIGVQYYDRKTSSKEWTNYSAAIFAKNPNQVNFLQSALIEGAIVEITAKQAKVDEYEGKYSIELIDASIGYIGTVGAPQQQQQQQQMPPMAQRAPQQQAPQQQQPYTGQPQQPQQPQNNMPMDSSIPF